MPNLQTPCQVPLYSFWVSFTYPLPILYPSFTFPSLFRVYTVAMAERVSRNWGGKRENSGRKRVALSDQEVRQLIRAAKKKKKETGISIADQVIDLIYAPKREVKPSQRIAALKLYYDQTVTAASESDVTTTNTNQPAIYLPEVKPDPATIKLVKAGNG